MSNINWDWLAQWWPGQADGPFTPLLTTVIALLALMLLWSAWRRRPAQGKAGRDYDTRADEFAPTAPISEEQVRLLHYLQQAFPDGAVLHRPRLARFLTVRKTRQRLGAQQRLADGQVDFLVCGDDGKPLFAFEIDAFKDQDDPDLAQGAAEKNRMLRTAGIRLVRLKGAQPQWPPPEALRMRLLAAQRAPVPVPAPAPEARLSGFAPSSFGPSSDFVHSRSAAESGVMSLTGLMGLQPADDPWASVRKR